MGKQFLDLVKNHFPPQNGLHRIFNQNTLELSCSCTKNIGDIVKDRNKTVLSTGTSEPKAVIAFEGKIVH